MEPKIAAAYRHCARIARTHYENFPVASLFLPKMKRAAIASIYAFARYADDLADEEDRTQEERLRLLDRYRNQLEACVSGQVDDPIFLALGETIRRFGLPVSLLSDLLVAFRRDVTVTRYETWDSLINEYCRFSANPVGRATLLLFGYRQDRLHARSDNICTALQLTNLWQDISVDLRKDRIYVPRELMDNHGYSESEFLQRRYKDSFRELVSDLVSRTRDLFERGAGLATQVDQRLGWQLRFVWLGGMRVLEKVESCPNLFLHRPRLLASDLPDLVGQALRYKTIVEHEAAKDGPAQL